MSEELNRMLKKLAQRGSPRGAAGVLDDAGRDAGLLSDPTPPRPSWHRNVLAFSGGALGIVILIGGVVLLRGTAPDDTPLQNPPVGATSAPASTAPGAPTPAAPSTSTTVAADPVISPPQISWERIDAPGAFDLESPLWTTDGELYSAQSIDAMLAAPSCSGCDDIAMYVAGGHVGIQPSQWDARIWISEDGHDWTAVEAPGFTGEGSHTISGFATDGTRIVATGMSVRDPYFPTTTDRALVWISDDLGRTWAPVESDALTVGSGRMTDIAWTGSGFIGAGSEFWSSPNGSTWEISTDLSRSEMVHQVVQWGSGWVAVGENPGGADWEGSGVAMWASDDGVSWESVFTGDPASDELTIAFDTLAGPDGLIATGLMQVWRSSDGITWERVPWEPDASALVRDMENLAAIGDWIVASGSAYSARTLEGRAKMWASPDGGDTWVDVPLTSDAFDPYNDEFGVLELLAFPAGGTANRLVLAGSHRGKAAIWVGTLEQ